MSSHELYDVGMIGVGFAGLIAARDLSARGPRVLVLEGRSRLGDRAWYRKFAGLDQPVEMGGTWIPKECMPAVLAGVERYGIELGDQAECTSFA